MNRYITCLTNDRGSALFVAILLIPVLTLFCVFASTVSFQNQLVTTNDKCYRDGFYDSDGAVYGTSKLISLIGKSIKRDAVEAGVGKAAPGLKYLSAGGDASDFVTELIEGKLKDTTEDVEFLKPDSDSEFGIESTVDILKFPGGNPAGGGAEFGNTADGIGAQMNVVVFRLQSIGRSKCPNTTVQVNADYWMLTSRGAQTKGI